MDEKYNLYPIDISAMTLGEAWLQMVEKIVAESAMSFDEDRSRLACQSMRFRSETHFHNDAIFKKYSDPENIRLMDELFFSQLEMLDFDVKPSFSPGAKSYYHRIVEGKMVDFIIERLSLIPESKKAVMVFPTYEDYKQVLENQRDDYLPCLVSFQVRLLKTPTGYKQNIYFFMRSWDAFQKAPGNLTAMAKLSEHIKEKLEQRLSTSIELGSMEGLITDAHIYEECIEDANRLLVTLGVAK